MFKKSLVAAGLIAVIALLTACGSSAPKTAEQTAQDTAAQTETVVAKEQPTAEEKVITDKNVTPKQTEAAETETTTKAAEVTEENETTTAAAEEETTTQEAQGPTEAYAVPQSDDEGEQGEMADLSAFFGTVSAEGGLTLRDGPGSDNDDLTIIPDGTQIAIEEVQDGWGRVEYDGMSGWVSLDYVE